MTSGDKQQSHTLKVWHCFTVFLKLGLTSFGGPAAHIGYFRKVFVEQKKWLSEQQFAQLFALCSFLPGPASSQLGFSIGKHHAGYSGALAAFVAFTMPSVLILVLFANLLPSIPASIADGTLRGLKWVACIVVADACWGMAQCLCATSVTRLVALCSCLVVLTVSSLWSQFAVIAFGLIVGYFSRDSNAQLDPQGRALNINFPAASGVLLIIFFALLAFLPFTAAHGELLNLASIFYQAGALVFGGGHVVLPLLEGAVVQTEMLSQQQFIAGYGAAQAVPGPLFTFAAYIAAIMPNGAHQGINVGIAIVFIFLPGFLLVSALLPIWQSLSQNVKCQGMVAGMNAAAVGLLLAAFFGPVITSGINSMISAMVVVIGIVLQIRYQFSPIKVVVTCLMVSLVFELISFHYFGC